MNKALTLTTCLGLTLAGASLASNSNNMDDQDRSQTSASQNATGTNQACEWPKNEHAVEEFVNSYLHVHNLTSVAEHVQEQAVLKTLQSLDYPKSQLDTSTLHLILQYYFPKESIQILNKKLFDFRIDDLCDALLSCPPNLDITHVARAPTPLNAARATSNETVNYYGILKFIGQYTDDKSVYDKCVATITKLYGKVEGPIMDADEVLFLMGQNKNFSGQKGFQQFKRPKNACFHKKKDLLRSIYRPDPVQSRQYEQTKHVYGSSLISIITGDNNDLSEVAKVLLVKHFMCSHFYIPKNTGELLDSRQVERALGAKGAMYFKIDLRDTALRIFTKETELNLAATQIDPKQSNIIKAQSIVEGLTLDDAYELMDVLDRDVRCWGKDPDNLAFELLFSLNIVPVDSDMAHYAIRRAAQYGNLGRVKYLVDLGVSVNPPSYKPFRRWIFEEDQTSPLALATSKRFSHEGPHPEVEQFLKDAGAE